MSIFPDEIWTFFVPQKGSYMRTGKSENEQIWHTLYISYKCAHVRVRNRPLPWGSPTGKQLERREVVTPKSKVIFEIVISL